MKIISDSSLKKLTENTVVRMRETGDYTKDVNDPFTRWIIRMLLGSDNKSVSSDDNTRNYLNADIPTADQLRVVNIYSGIFYIINKKIANGVGKAMIPDKLGKYKYFRDNTKDLITCGITGYEYLQNTDGSKGIGYVPASELVIENVPTRYVYMERDDGKIYLFRKKYYDLYNTNELFLLDENSRQSGTPVNLETLPEFAGYKPTETLTVGPSIAIAECESLYKKVESLVLTFERNLVATQAQFYKYLEAWLIMKGVKFSSQDRNEDGSLKMTAIKNKVIQTSDATASVEYVALENPALQTLIDFTKDQLIRQISAITSIPTTFFGLEEGTGALGENTWHLKLQDFVQECEDYRELHTEAFDYLFKVANIKDGSIIWGDVIREQNKALLDEYKSADSLGITSRKRMIMEFWDMDEKEAEEFIKEIDADTVAQQALIPPVGTAGK